VIWANVQYASQEAVDELLWATHVSVTNCYRKIITRIHRPDQIVLKRKLEKLYTKYIKTTQDFYKGFLQRFCARYHLQDLKRIVSKAKLEMEVPDEDQIDAKSANISGIVTGIGHSTLIYLGDLSRYRTLMRAPERRSWEQALTYYSLANDLKPDSGFGHHQCGVIFTENSDHLSIVYHLYRSLASPEPHPNAFANLDRECKDLAKLQSRSLSNDKEALLLWFVKLHAYLFKGDETRQHEELVEEVLHRLGTSLAQQIEEQENEVDAALLKMVLINICAYHVSLQKVDSK
jgi:protein SMG7